MTYVQVICIFLLLILLYLYLEAVVMKEIYLKSVQERGEVDLIDDK